MRTQQQGYEAPRAVIMGAADGLVRASQDGERLDADFPAGTPRGELTFS